MIRLLALLMLLAWPLRAEETVVLGLSQDEVSITATFDGSDILIFGAIKRETPIPAGSPLQVVVTVAGPARPVTVRRKERLGPIWINRSAQDSHAPSFYAIASSAPLDQILSPATDAQLRITMPWAIGAQDGTPDEFEQALIRLRTRDDAYQRLEGAVSVSEQTLFRTQIALPADLTEGNFRARIILLRDGLPLDVTSTVIPVQKVGLERFLFTASRESPLLYGIASLVIAIIAGWAASTLFRLIKL